MELSYAGFTLGAWYADSPGDPYDEFNGFLEYRRKLGDFEFYAGYTYLRFIHGGVSLTLSF